VVVTMIRLYLNIFVDMRVVASQTQATLLVTVMMLLYIARACGSVYAEPTLVLGAWGNSDSDQRNLKLYAWTRMIFSTEQIWCMF
jgi:hypothetical protein